jgi:hypothetical protein
VTDREPVDVKQIVKDWLKVRLAQRFPELFVTLELPSNWTPKSPPALVIADDGDPLIMYPVATSPTIRITSWTGELDRTYVHAALPILLTERIPGIAKVLPGTGFLDTRDPKTKGDLSSFTVRARARLAVPQ